MTFIGISQLKSYDGWIGKNASDIKRAVKNLPHGWASVFNTRKAKTTEIHKKDKTVPQWANLIRNYFNESPRELRRLSPRESMAALKSLQQPGLFAKFGVATENIFPIVYRDQKNRNWFQMPPAGIIYHIGDGSGNSYPAGKVGAFTTGKQEEFPFKLISPDGTGGSSEVIIQNGYGKTVLTKNGQKTDVRKEIVWDIRTRGSYNYAETNVRGYTQHKLNDMDPHEEMKKRTVYINPPAFSTLESRVFLPGLM